MNEEGHDEDNDSTDEKVVNDLDISNQSEIHSDSVKSSKNIFEIVKPDVEAIHNGTTAMIEPNIIVMNEGKESNVNTTSRFLQSLMKRHMHGKYDTLERGYESNTTTVGKSQDSGGSSKLKMEELKNPVKGHGTIDNGIVDGHVHDETDGPISVKHSIILQRLGVNGTLLPGKVEPKSFHDVKSIKSKQEEENEEEEVKLATFPPDNDDDYLDYSLYADYYNDPEENLEDNDEDILEVIKYRDFPMEDGYVRIPVFVPGLEVEEVSEVPQLWSAQEAFMRQVGSKLYMFIPSAILGFLIGLLLWVVGLAFLRIFGLLKNTFRRVFGTGKDDDLDLNAMYNLSGDPWIKISDAQKIHSGNGSIRKSVLDPVLRAKPVLARHEDEVFSDVFTQHGRRSWRGIGARKIRRLSH